NRGSWSGRCCNRWSARSFDGRCHSSGRNDRHLERRKGGILGHDLSWRRGLRRRVRRGVVAVNHGAAEFGHSIRTHGELRLHLHAQHAGQSVGVPRDVSDPVNVHQEWCTWRGWKDNRRAMALDLIGCGAMPTDLLPPTLSEALLSVMRDLGFDTLTPIQVEAIPLLLAGRDLVGQSRTGSGKTAAFGLPILQRLNLET